ncbi:hypothetical protein [Stenotrophomonas acidaminiphila]|uniref:hypothetical protein n=1 Tax=Stenotrophomonas acidaminiphila TaxID=128780 RepID=UPI003D08376C
MLTSHPAVEKRLFGPRFFARAKKSSSTAEWLVKVARSCEAGAKALLSSFSFHALPLASLDPLPIALATTSRGSKNKGRNRIKGFRSPSGRELLFFARAKKR